MRSLLAANAPGNRNRDRAMHAIGAQCVAGARAKLIRQRACVASERLRSAFSGELRRNATMSRLLPLVAITCACALVTRTDAGEQVANITSPVAALGFKAVPHFFNSGPGPRRGEASGVSLNSKGH